VVETPKEFGAKPFYLPRQKTPGSKIVDLRGKRLFVNNSKNRDPKPALRCDAGELPTNSYPLNIFSIDGVSIIGGVIEGSVPQQSDWDASYCNSAAVNLKNAAGGVIDGIRISRAWDGVRIGPESGKVVIRNAWLSDIRDDAVENDNLLEARIIDTLIDGALQGVSLRPNARSKIGASQSRLVITGSLFRLREYPYKGRPELGSLIKADPRSPRITITNRVIAIDSPQDDTPASSWALMLSKLDPSAHNLLLWLSDRPVPERLQLPDSGFRLLRGADARAAWNNAKLNWIHCHGRVGRLASDPRSDPAKCRPQTWGGYTN
jgi:hypothetical protein